MLTVETEILTLTGKSNTFEAAMRITSKGQVTIPIAIREKAGLLPNTEVEFDYDGKTVRIRPTRRKGKLSRGDEIVAHLRRHPGTVNLNMTTDEIMALMRGDD
jgi:AbrB family looped-hinge helix DNA binding protein